MNTVTTTTQPVSDESPERFGRLGIGAISVVAANAFFLLLYFRFDFNLFQLVLVYWVECFWVGLFCAFRLVVASILGDPFENRFADVSRGGNLFLSLLVIWFAGGAFLSVFGMTGLLSLFAISEGFDASGMGDTGDYVIAVIGGSILLAIAHGVVFVVDFLLLGEFKRARAGTLVWIPFKRCFGFLGMLIVALTAVFLFPAFATTHAFAVMLIVLKVMADCRQHMVQRT